MKVAVTGGSGKIGSEVVRDLREHGHDVLSLDIRPPSDSSIPHLVCDLRVASALRKAFDGCDAVCHLGEWPNVYGGPAETFSHNTETGSTVMATAQQCGVRRLIYTSTAQTYGYWGCDITTQPMPPMCPIDETLPLRANNAYALGKIANERFGELLTRDGTIDIAAVRIPFVVPVKHAEWIIHDSRRREDGFPEGFGTYAIAEDVAKGFRLMLEVGWTGFDTFHFFAEDFRFQGDMRELFRKTWPDIVLPADWDGTTPPVTTAKARQRLGWTPDHSLRTLIPDFEKRLAKTA